MTDNIDEFYTVVLECTKAAGKLISDRIFSVKSKVETKSCDIDFVTETDQEVEKLLMESISKKFPDHRFIGEESVSTGANCELTDLPTWIIDPIDGTMNFVHGFPHSCISIALFVAKTPEIAIIYNPIIDQLFTARKGHGAYLNGKRINVSGKEHLKDALVIMEFGCSRDLDRLKTVYANQEMLMNQAHGIRALGSAALDMAMVALGGADAYFEFGIHIWDFAAGELIVREAGGVVVDPSGGPLDRFSRRVLAAASAELAKELSEKIVQLHPMPRD